MIVRRLRLARLAFRMRSAAGHNPKCGCRPSDHRDYLAGTWLRELAVGLASHDDLSVSVVTYEGKSQGLQVVLTGAPHCDGIMIDHNKTGDQCQLTLERWVWLRMSWRS